LVGLKLTDERVAELLPQLQKTAALAKENRSLDLTDVEPDFKFDPRRL
jgi:Asp-tRNA(Asn)/Glu-tRNA(Gln) amidotransferase C subunit